MWTTLSFAIFVGVKVLIFGSVANVDRDYFSVYVTLGLFVWTFVSSNFNDGCAVFWTAEGWIKGMRLPVSLFVFQSVARDLYLTFFMSLVAVGVFVVAGIDLKPAALWAIPMFALLVVNGFCVQLMLGVISTRVRDVNYLVQTAISVLFFLLNNDGSPEGAGAIIRNDLKIGRSIVALSNISLHLKDGDLLGLVGRNGSGKSTLLRVAGGIYEPFAGRVRVVGSVAGL